MSKEDTDPGYMDKHTDRQSPLAIEHRPRGFEGNEIKYVVRLNRLHTIMLHDLQSTVENSSHLARTMLGMSATLIRQIYAYEYSVNSNVRIDTLISMTDQTLDMWLPEDYAVSDVYLLNSKAVSTTMPLHILFSCAMLD